MQMSSASREGHSSWQHKKQDLSNEAIYRAKHRLLEKLLHNLHGLLPSKEGEVGHSSRGMLVGNAYFGHQKSGTSSIAYYASF